MKLKNQIAVCFATLLMASPGISLAADAAAGKAKAAVCAACHGADGIAQIPGYPNLAGQNEAYLVSSLKAYKNKQRNGGQAVIMHAQSAGLSDDDIANLAAYYSAMPAGGK